MSASFALVIQVDASTRALGQIIDSNAREIEARWLRRVQEDIVGRPDVELSHLRNAMPDYLKALSQLLSEGSNAGAGAVWADIAREHGVTRVRIGFDIDQLIREFIVLRQEIGAVGAERGVATTSTESALADLIGAAITESVRAYVAARDYETRRVQAENIGFLTHELRNPLANGIFATAMLREQATPQQERALEILERSHRRLTELIDSVLHAERLEAGKVEPRMVDVREGELLERATEAGRKAAKAKGVAVEVRGAPARTIHVDPDLTRSALQNLVDNAVNYTDEGRVEVATEEDEVSWSVHVHDNCDGLSQEELRTIFEPFRRGATTKKGTGLGLSIARRAIEAQGGSIHAESPGPNGCHFWITLPKK